MSKKGPVVDEATLVAESWADLAHESEGYSPYHQYQTQKNKGQARYERNASKIDKPKKYQTASSSIKPVVLQTETDAVQLEDTQRDGSYNTHHQKAIRKFR